MGHLISNFFKRSISGVVSSAPATFNNPYVNMNQALTKFMEQIREQQPRYDSIISAFTSDPNLIADEMLDNAKIPVNNGLCVTEISEDTATDIIDGIRDAISNGSYEAENFGITISDAKGHIYNLYDQGDECIVDGKVVFLSCTNFVSSIDEAIVYLDPETGKYYFNNIIRSADFRHADAEIVTTNTILEQLETCCFLCNGEVPTTIDRCLSIIEAYSGIEQSSSTIYDRVETLHQRYLPGGAPDSIIDMTRELEGEFIRLFPVTSASGVYSSIWSVLVDFMEASSLNSAIYQVGDALMHFQNFSADFFSTVTSTVGTNYNSVKTFLNDCKCAFLKGGFYGAIKYILSYASAGSKMTNSEGLLSFSDNSNLVPQQYIAGMFVAIATTIGSAVGLVVSLFAPVVGLVLSGVSMLFGGIFNSIKADAQDRYVGMIVDETVRLPIAPYALFQMTYPTSELDQSLQDLFISGSEMVSIEVPGGWLLIGLHTAADAAEDAPLAERYPLCIIKFYPSIINHKTNRAYSPRAIFSSIDNLLTADYSDFSISHPLQPGSEVQVYVNPYALHGVVTAKQVCDSYYKAGKLTDYVSDEDGYIKSSTMDNLMRSVILENIAWFVLWALASSYRMPVFEWSIKCEVVGFDTDNYVIGLLPDSGGDANKYSVYSIMAQMVYLYSSYSRRGVRVTNEHCYLTQYKKSEVISLAYYLSDKQSYDWVWLGKFSTENARAISQPIVDYNLYPFITSASIDNNVTGPLDFPSNSSFAIRTPKYDSRTFLTWIIVSAVVTAAVVVGTVAATLGVKKAINRKRAQNQANVEAAWERLKADPTAESYADYRKAVKRNNRWATLIGGTKYDYVNYWNGDTSNSGDEDGSISSGLFDSFLSNSDDAVSEVAANNEMSSGEIIRLIRGPSDDNQ